MTFSYQKTQFPRKPIRPRQPSRRRPARTTRSPRRLPEHLSSALLLRRMLLLVAAGLLLIGAIALWRMEKSHLIRTSQYEVPQFTCCESYIGYPGANGSQARAISTIVVRSHLGPMLS